MSYRYILAFDPSGNFHEGKGTTGWVVMDHKENLLERGYISAKQYRCPEEFWQAHLDLIDKYHNMYRNNLIVVMEDYVLYRDKSNDQTNSKMETCRLLGLMQWRCWVLKQPYTLQLAASVKVRWSDELLYRERIIRRDGRNIIHNKSGLSLGLIHTRDAFRHAIHYAATRNHPSDQTNRDFGYRPKKYVKTRKYKYDMEDDYNTTDYHDSRYDRNFDSEYDTSW